MNLRGRHPGAQQLARYFAYSHLPAHLQETAKECYDLAERMFNVFSDSTELTAGLRKLLEARECFLRLAEDAHHAEEK